MKELSKKISYLIIMEKIKFYLPFALAVLLVLILVINSTFVKTEKFIQGEVLSTFTSPSSLRYRPGDANIQVRMRTDDSKKINVSVPIKLNPNKGDVFLFEIHESIIFSRIKYVPIKKIE